MLDTIKELLGSQFEAAFCMLSACINKCPDEAWNAKVANLTSNQVAFHTLFYADVHLGRDLDALKRQPFHRDNAAFFGDYEELQPRAQAACYDRASIRKYLEFCRIKASEVLAAETADSLSAKCGFERRDFSRAELHVYNIRHLQHHAAQLSLRLRLDAKADVPWIGSGWRDL